MHETTTTAQITEMRNLYASGMTLSEIATKIGKSRSTVNRYVMDIAKSSGRSLGTRITEDQISRMQQLRSQGLSNYAIARKMGISLSTITAHIGSQPYMNKESYGGRKAFVTDVEKKEELIMPEKKIEPPKEEKRESSLKLISSVQTFKGKYYTYKVGFENKVRINNSTGATFDIPMEEFETVVTELIDLYSTINRK